jgi:hypothetical protein
VKEVKKAKHINDIASKVKTKIRLKILQLPKERIIENNPRMPNTKNKQRTAYKLV